MAMPLNAKNGLCKVPVCAESVPWGHLLCRHHYAHVTRFTQRGLNIAWKQFQAGTMSPDEYSYWRDRAIREASS